MDVTASSSQRKPRRPQRGDLYAEVLPIFLCDGAATKAGIFEGLAAMERNMARGGGQDMAVVMFSGHGAVMDGQFYLVPHGVDNGTKASLKASAIPASEFQREILNLSRHGRVLVLLDACCLQILQSKINSLSAA